MSEVNKSEVSNSEKSKKDLDDPKAKFREALEKKKLGSRLRNTNTTASPKVSGGQTIGNTPKIFRRKSGSA
jgi:hypothetical protein